MLRFASPRPGESPTVDGAGLDDEIRARVEATLHRAVGDVLGLPCQAAKAARSAVRDVARKATQPIAVTRSVIGLVRAGVSGAGAPSGGPARPTDPSRAYRPDNVMPVPESAGAVDDVTAVVAATLPLEDYESLPASHVVARLDRLDQSELEAIRDFEDAHRGRRTVVGRIEQLLAER